jgi:hypothetical protein
MTMPMTIEEKREQKADVFKLLKKIEAKVRLAHGCLTISGEDDFDSDYIVIAKNMALEAQNDCQAAEHMLHEVMDAQVMI